MGRREATAFALGPLILVAIAFLPSWAYLAAMWFATLMAAWELLAMVRRLEIPAPRVATLVVLAIALPAIWWLGLRDAGLVLAAVVVVLPLVYLLGRFPVAGATGGMACSLLVALYFAVFGGAMGLLRTSFPDPLGWKAVVTLIITIWAGDSGAYYLGSRFGRHKLSPRVSPNKTWEGAFGGLLLTFVGVAFCRAVFFPELSVAAGVTMASILTVVAPLGDLVESLFKRDSGVKDSSQLIPGHGGFLDRTDSLFFAAPFVLAVLLLFGVGA